MIPDPLRMLYEKNGFFAFESALEVFPTGRSPQSYSIEEWNDYANWLICYDHLSPKGLIFSQDVFGTQFIVNDAIYSFNPETAETSYFAESIEDWAQQILDEYDVLTGHPLAHAWQVANGPLPKRSRLVPVTPFVLGGAYSLDNLIAMDAAAAMRLRANLALQIVNLPDGASVVYKVD